MADVKEERQQPQRAKPSGANVTSIVRISGRDVNGSLSISRAIHMVKGIGASMSYAIASVVEEKLGIPKGTSIGSLSEGQISQIEQIIRNPAGNGIPGYMLNRNKDMETGGTLHNVSNELLFSMRQDVARDMSLRDWRGFRHQYGQKVRGQHTRSTGRTGATVGVTKKAAKEAQRAARAAERKRGKREAAPSTEAAAPAAPAAAPSPAQEKG